MWGLLTLYFPLLKPAGPVEILAHRVVWSFALVVLLLTVVRRWPHVWSVLRSPRTLTTLVVAGVLIGANWGSYIWAINSDHVIDASLGYYLNPLVSAALGVAVLHERLHAAQWIASTLAAGGVLWLFLDSGRPPWVSLALAGTFALYGLAKKKANVEMLEGLVVENAALSVPALVFLVVVGAHGNGQFATDVGSSLLLISTGLATMLPLMLFGFAVTRIALISTGMLQFLTPTLQFVIGLFGFHESLGAAGLLPYGLVWAGVVCYMGGLVLRSPFR
jgi:chloramphenicol-sensitive protein RarD